MPSLSDNDNIVQSPCIRNCCLNDDDICLGCFRLLDEITQWGEANNHERMVILKNAQQRRGSFSKPTRQHD
jgi:predicted Fe-S protein YdhL (DUF1289 family)